MATEQISAQSAFITEYQASQISMTTANTTRYAALQSDAQNQSIKIVATADVRTQQVGGKLRFLLPGLSDSLFVEATLIRDDSSGFVWSGKITNKPGYVSFLKSNGLTSGFIQVGTHFYELMPMGTNYQFLLERSPGGDKGCSNAGITNPPPSSPPIGPDYCTAIGSAYNTCPALIYMLLVITPAAKTYIMENYGSINNFVLQGQNIINLAFSNSDIPNKEVAIKWIEKDLTQANNSLSAPPNKITDHDNLPILLEPERTNYRADVAFLITNQGYGDIAGAVYAYGPDKATAYGFIEAPYFINYYTIAHELGHLLGCRHNWPSTAGDDDVQTCAHGYRWIEDVGPIEPLQTYQIENSFETLVAISASTAVAYPVEDANHQLYYIQFTANAATNRILNYSNPDISYGGYATGIVSANSADNARLIRNTACEVADFVESQDLALLITTSSCSTVPFTFSANITAPKLGFPGQGPYTVTWYWNIDGNFNTSLWNGGNETYLGSGLALTVSPHPYCQMYWVKCKVVAADGTTLVRFKKIDLTPLYCYCQALAPGGGDGRSTIPGLANGSGLLSIYPNPVADGIMMIQDRILTNSTGQATISDLSGHTVLSHSIIFDDNGQAPLSVDPLPDGLYLLRLSGSNGLRHNLKFIIAKN